ncbi:hypothetical protein ACJ41O_013991 [Fusarium nematophilum]
MYPLYAGSQDGCGYFHQTLGEIDYKTWIVGGRILISHHDSPQPGPCWGDGHGGFYTASEAQHPLQPSRRVKETGHITLVDFWQEQAAIWAIGECFLKVQMCATPEETREHVTLDALKKRNMSLLTPRTIFHAEMDGFYYLIYEKIPGQPLSEAWHRMDRERMDRCASQVARFCRELSAEKRNGTAGLVGVDGGRLNYGPLASAPGPCGNEPQELLKNCKEMGMDCETLVFAHNAITADEIIVDGEGAAVGVQEWQSGGFVPEEWVTGSFRYYSPGDGPGSDQERYWFSSVAAALKQEELKSFDFSKHVKWEKETEDLYKARELQYNKATGMDKRLQAARLIRERSPPKEVAQDQEQGEVSKPTFH